MGQLRRVSREAWALLAGVLIVLCTAAVAVAGAGTWDFGLAQQTRATVVAVVVGTASFALVAVSALVAIAAYWASTGRPKLEVTVAFPFSFENEPVLRAEVRDAMLAVVSYKQTEGRVRLENHSLYAARNPGVRIDFDGLLGLGEQAGWESLQFHSTVGLVSIQWDGGTEKIVHGNWWRMLPDLNLDGVEAYPSAQPRMVITVVAEGLRPTKHVVPIRFLKGADYERYSAERLVRLTSET